MNSIIKTYILLFLWLVPVLHPYAQSDSIPSIKLIARAYQDSIVLRWAPTTPVAWELANKYGYTIEKYTLLRNGEFVKPPLKTTLTSQPLLPLPLADWERLVDQNDNAGIAAQAIYGETFELTNDYASDLSQVVNKTRELTSRFSFALFAADVSRQVAKASGLLFTDTKPQKGENYLYRVYANVPPSAKEIDTGFVYIGLSDYEDLPKPVQVSAEFSDQAVMLKWNQRYHSHIYTAYQVEKSSDGGQTFHSISKLPLVNTSPEKGSDPDFMFRSDTLAKNGKSYQYRIFGLTPFGDKGPPSEIIEGYGNQFIQATPSVTQVRVVDNQKVQLEWTFPKDQIIKGFIVERADQANGSYKSLSENYLPANQFTFEDINPKTANYYRIKAVSNTGASTTSFPHVALLVDSIPPNPPENLTGNIDTNGIVTLGWLNNEEKDILGYRVFTANHPTDEFVQVTVSPISESAFQDSISIKTLTEKIYYKVKAVDQHHNPSDFSEIIALKKPDIIPPASPMIYNVKASTEGIVLNWYNSSSEDVVRHSLYRKPEKAEQWDLIATFDTDFPDSFMDSLIAPKQLHQYTIVATDDAGLESRPSQPVSSQRIDNGIRPAIGKIVTDVDREKQVISIAWDYNQQGVSAYQIYRAKDEDPLRLYKTVVVSENLYKDTAMTVGANYTYRVKAIYGDGAQSPFSDEVVVSF